MSARHFFLGASLAAAMIGSASAHAAPYQGTNNASGESSTIVFSNSLSQDQAINSYYANDGVTFTNFFQDYADGPYPNTGTANAADFQYSGNPQTAELATISFAAPVTSASIAIISDLAGYTFTSLLHGQVVESLVTSTDYSQSNNFYGFVGSSFDEILIAPTDSGNYAVFNNLAFSSSAISAAPEPSTWLLMFAGIGGIGLMMRQAKRKMGFRFKDALAA